MARIPPELHDVLVYLDEIGYGELYVDRLGVNPDRDRPADAERPRPREAAVARPERLEPEPPQRSIGSPPSPSIPHPSPRGERDAPTRGTDSDHGPGPEERAEALAALAAEAEVCEKCALARGRNKVVFGTGDPNADLMFVGEGPGAEEDRQGLPFVGAAGQLLDKIIQAIGLERAQVYIANVVKCRPPGNRDPLPDEAAACRPYLDRQIDLVQPKVIVALGRVAAQALLGNDLPLGRMRGRWFKVRGVPTMVTYHPAALLRNRAWKRPTWEDMQAVRDRLQD
jgi:uracil-DNA glycosylase family 4